jgi:hypothetical protein
MARGAASAQACPRTGPPPAMLATSMPSDGTIGGLGGGEMPDEPDAQYWRDRAKDARARAMKDSRSERHILRLADFYERLADRLGQRLRKAKKSK